MNRAEKNVWTAHRMYECREAARTLLGEKYAEKLEPYRKVVRGVADAECGGSELAAVTRIVNKAGGRLGEDSRTGLILYCTAAAVEEIEARGAVLAVAGVLSDVLADLTEDQET